MVLKSVDGSKVLNLAKFAIGNLLDSSGTKFSSFAAL